MKYFAAVAPPRIQFPLPAPVVCTPHPRAVSSVAMHLPLSRPLLSGSAPCPTSAQHHLGTLPPSTMPSELIKKDGQPVHRIPPRPESQPYTQYPPPHQNPMPMQHSPQIHQPMPTSQRNIPGTSDALVSSLPFLKISPAHSWNIFIWITSLHGPPPIKQTKNEILRRCGASAYPVPSLPAPVVCTPHPRAVSSVAMHLPLSRPLLSGSAPCPTSAQHHLGTLPPSTMPSELIKKDGQPVHRIPPRPESQPYTQYPPRTKTPCPCSTPRRSTSPCPPASATCRRNKARQRTQVGHRRPTRHHNPPIHPSIYREREREWVGGGGRSCRCSPGTSDALVSSLPFLKISPAHSWNIFIWITSLHGPPRIPFLRGCSNKTNKK
eukprot:gene6783-4865_t